MGAAGLDVETRDRGMGNSDIDKRINYFLVDNYDKTIACFDQLSQS